MKIVHKSPEVHEPWYGRLILVTGPSGAGKDTLLHAARQMLSADSHFEFAIRVITRPVDGGAEQHTEMSRIDFARARADGQFGLWWQAHDMYYGVGVETLCEISGGRCVVLNASRSIVQTARTRYPRLSVINVTASDVVLQRRLLQRGRESPEQIAARLARAHTLRPTGPQVVEHINEDELELSAARFVETLRALSRG